MTTYYALLLFTLPIPWIAKLIWPHQIKWPELAATLVVNFLVVTLLFFTGTAGQTSDREIWSGEIVSKDRKHGHYLRPYSCRCRQTCSGSGSNRSCYETCDTCYEDRYTVTWTARSNIGDFTIEHLDRSSSGVYKTVDPARYTEINKGDPCSRSVPFTNYVKAVPESLFHANPVILEKFKDMIPEYPGKIYDIYKINRVVSVGVSLPDMAAWNQDLSLVMRKLGPQRQANVIIVFVNTDDPKYAHALESRWIGGKKNDAILVVGTKKYPEIDWVHVMGWSKNQLFNVALRDEVQAMEKIDRTSIMQAVEKHVGTTFQRRHMSEFEYLKDEIEPPFWAVVVIGILGVLLSLGASYYFYRHDPWDTGSSNGPRRYRKSY